MATRTVPVPPFMASNESHRHFGDNFLHGLTDLFRRFTAGRCDQSPGIYGEYIVDISAPHFASATILPPARSILCFNFERSFGSRS